MTANKQTKDNERLFKRTREDLGLVGAGNVFGFDLTGTVQEAILPGDLVQYGHYYWPGGGGAKATRLRIAAQTLRYCIVTEVDDEKVYGHWADTAKQALLRSDEEGAKGGEFKGAHKPTERCVRLTPSPTFDEEEKNMTDHTNNLDHSLAIDVDPLLREAYNKAGLGLEDLSDLILTTTREKRAHELILETEATQGSLELEKLVTAAKYELRSLKYSHKEEMAKICRDESHGEVTLERMIGFAAAIVGISFGAYIIAPFIEVLF